MTALWDILPCLHFKVCWPGCEIPQYSLEWKRGLINGSSRGAWGKSISLCEINVTSSIWCKPALSWCKLKWLNTSQWTCPTDAHFRPQSCHSGRWPGHCAFIYAKAVCYQCHLILGDDRELLLALPFLCLSWTRGSQTSGLIYASHMSRFPITKPTAEHMKGRIHLLSLSLGV